MSNRKNKKKIDYRILFIIFIFVFITLCALIASVKSIISLKNNTYKPIINWGVEKEVIEDDKEKNIELNEIIKTSIKEYVSSIYVNDVECDELFPNFTKTDEIPDYYLMNVAYKELLNTKPEKSSFTYDEINKILVNKLGLSVNKLLTSDYSNDKLVYNQETKQYDLVVKKLMNKSREYVIENIYEQNNTIFVELYEYYGAITNSKGEIIDKEEVFSNKKDYYYELKTLTDLTIKKYNYEEVSDNGVSTMMITDDESNVVSKENMDSVVLEQKDKFIKRTLEIEYDEENDLYYLLKSYTK